VTAYTAALLTKREPGRHSRLRQRLDPAIGRAEHHQLQLTVKIVLLVSGTIFFFSLGVPGPAVICLAAAFLAARPPRRPEGLRTRPDG